MAFIDNVTYNGKYASELISPVFFDDSILSEFTIRDGVKGKITVGKLGISGHVQPGACGWDPAGNIQLDPRELSVCSFKINEVICYEDLESSFLSEQLRAGSSNSFGPAEFTAKLLSDVQADIAEKMQDVLWNGDAGLTAGPAYLNECDGLLKLFGPTGANVIGLSGTGITAGNVIAEMQRVVAAIPARLKSRAIKPNIYVAQNVADAYLFSQINTTGGLLPVGEKELNFMGYTVKVANLMPSNKMVAAVPTNIWIGTDLMSDLTSIGVEERPKEAAAHVWAQWKFGVQFGIGSEIVYYY